MEGGGGGGWEIRLLVQHTYFVLEENTVISQSYTQVTLSPPLRPSTVQFLQFVIKAG